MKAKFNERLTVSLNIFFAKATDIAIIFININFFAPNYLGISTMFNLYLLLPKKPFNSITSNICH